MTGQESVTGHLSVTQDNNGNEGIAACLTVTTPPEPTSSTTVNFWSLTTQSDSTVV